jgi:hypothetical protein
MNFCALMCLLSLHFYTMELRVTGVISRIGVPGDVIGEHQQRPCSVRRFPRFFLRMYMAPSLAARQASRGSIAFDDDARDDASRAGIGHGTRTARRHGTTRAAYFCF